MNNFVVVVDTQYDFMMPDGILYVYGAEETIVPITKYLASLNPEETTGVLFTYDTHIRKDYEISPESKMFPLHCELGTKGHKNVINPDILNIDIDFYEFKKPVFNMWAEEASKEQLWLGGVIPTTRNVHDFFTEDVAVEIIDVLGVALNFCVKQAVNGFLDRGFRVRLHTSMTRGIDTGNSGDLDARILYAEEIMNGKVILVD